MDRVVIIGSGAAGLSAAIRLAEENVPSFIVEAVSYTHLTLPTIA